LIVKCLESRRSDYTHTPRKPHAKIDITSYSSSIALLAGISSISTGAGPCEGSHSLGENCEIEPLYKGIKKVLLLELTLAGME
jgi:hypothetical protein